MNSKYCKELKQHIIDLYKHGESYTSLMATYGIPQSTLYRWLKDYRHFMVVRGKQLYAKDISLLLQEVKRLRIEIDLLKRARCSPHAPLSVRLPEMIRLQEETGCTVYMLCKTFDVLKSTYYHRVLRSPERTQLEIADDSLKPIIKEVFDEGKGRFGSAMIKVKLNERGFQVSPKRIVRLMQSMGLQCSRNMPTLTEYKRTYIKTIHYTGNKLKNQFSQAAPNRAWVSDTTYLRTVEGVFFLCVIIDLFSRRVIGHTLSRKEDTILSLETLDKALANRTIDRELVFHSDQGSIYTAKEFMDKIKKHGIIQSFSRTAMPYDNAVAESFFATYKKEEVYQHVYHTFAELSESVEEYIHFFNHDRPRYTLGMKTPCQIEADYYKNRDK